MAGHHFMVDVALTRDRQIAAVFAGEPVQAHAAGMKFVSRVMLEQLPHPVDAVITSCAGYPLDLTFYQAIKGITAAQHIVKKGGRILLVAECQEGPGAAEFCDMLKKTDSGASFLDLIKEAPVVVDQWQLEKLALVTQKADILFYTPGLPGEYPQDAVGSGLLEARRCCPRANERLGVRRQHRSDARRSVRAGEGERSGLRAFRDPTASPNLMPFRFGSIFRSSPVRTAPGPTSMQD